MVFKNNSESSSTDSVPIDIVTREENSFNADPVPLSTINNNNDADDDCCHDSTNDTKESTDLSVSELLKLLELERQKALDMENKLKYALADFQNLDKKTQSTIEHGVQTRVDELMLHFLQIYDDFNLAKKALSTTDHNIDGLNSILKNMDSLLKKYQVKSIDALGEIFDPNYHEAVSIVNDSILDDNVITKEIRKGYISHDRVIRPTLVEISKK